MNKAPKGPICKGSDKCVKGTITKIRNKKDPEYISDWKKYPTLLKVGTTVYKCATSWFNVDDYDGVEDSRNTVTASYKIEKYNPKKNFSYVKPKAVVKPVIVEPEKAKELVEPEKPKEEEKPKRIQKL